MYLIYLMKILGVHLVDSIVALLKYVSLMLILAGVLVGRIG